MDLKDVVSSVYANAAEAHKAFHAGHHDTAENYLKSVMIQVGKYLDEKKLTPAEVTEQANGDTPDTVLAEQPVQDPGSSVHPAVVDPSAETKEFQTDLEC